MSDIERRLAADDDRLDTLTATLLDAADREGLLDVAYATVDSPVGELLVASTEAGLVTVAYDRDRHWDDTLQEIADVVSPRVAERPARLDPVRRELDEYFEGHRDRFDLPIDWRLVRGGFTRQVLEAVTHVPYGQVVTYGDIAAEAGNPKAYRAAGNALGSNPIPIVVPCHRVVAAGGRFGGYTGGREKKEHLLRLEGALLA